MEFGFYEVLTTIHPPYIHSLISVQPPRSTRSSSLVTLAQPPTSSSLCITDRSFRQSYSSLCLWNQLPSSLCKHHPSLSITVSLFPVLSQIFRTIDSLPASGLTLYRFFSLTQIFCFSILFITFSVPFGSMHRYIQLFIVLDLSGSIRQIKLVTRYLLDEGKYSLSYHFPMVVYFLFAYSYIRQNSLNLHYQCGVYCLFAINC